MKVNIYSINGFLASGATVYGIVGALSGALSGLGVSILIIYFQGLLNDSLINTLAYLGVTIIITAAIVISALFGGVFGAFYGALRASVIRYTLVGGRDGLAILLVIVLAIFFVEIIGGLILFLTWRSFRQIPFNKLRFLKVMRHYIFIYALFFLPFGILLGYGFEALLEAFANKSNDDGAVRGILIATMVIFYGVVLSIILSALDFLVVKYAVNRNLKFPESAGNGFSNIDADYADSAALIKKPPATTGRGKKESQS